MLSVFYGKLSCLNGPLLIISRGWSVQLQTINSLNYPLCRECGGRCCQGSPGLWIDPQRFLAIFFAGKPLPLEQMRECLPALGLVLWEKSGVPIPAPLFLVDGCAFLGKDGCSFPVSERPCQCLALIPDRETLAQSEGSLCRLPSEFSKVICNQKWQDYWQSF